MLNTYFIRVHATNRFHNDLHHFFSKAKINSSFFHLKFQAKIKMYSKKVQMEKKIVIKCGYMWQLICWILAFLGHQHLHCWAPIAIKWIMRRKQMIQNFIPLSHSNMDVNLFQYPSLHNAHSGELNSSIYGHFPLQCVCLPKSYKLQFMSMATHPKFKHIRAIFEVVLSLDL